WAGSCWYYLRYLDAKNGNAFCDLAKLKQWLPVDLYVGGAEHAVLHLLYSRFWHKVLFDRGHVPCAEPFQRLVNQGMILGETDYYPAYTQAEILGILDKNRTRNGAAFQNLYERTTEGQEKEIVFGEDEVEAIGKSYFWRLCHDIEVSPRADKMSKSR